MKTSQSRVDFFQFIFHVLVQLSILLRNLKLCQVYFGAVFLVF